MSLSTKTTLGPRGLSAEPDAGEVGLDGNLETALRRAAFWTRRGMPRTAAELLAGTDGLLRFRATYGDLAATLSGGEEVRVRLSPARRRVTITRTAGDRELTGSANLPSHLVGHAG